MEGSKPHQACYLYRVGGSLKEYFLAPAEARFALRIHQKRLACLKRSQQAIIDRIWAQWHYTHSYHRNMHKRQRVGRKLQRRLPCVVHASNLAAAGVRLPIATVLNNNSFKARVEKRVWGRFAH